jgi:hypothetical protein
LFGLLKKSILRNPGVKEWYRYWSVSDRKSCSKKSVSST